MSKLLKASLFSLFLALAVVGLGLNAQAQTNTVGGTEKVEKTSTADGGPEVKLTNPIGNIKTPQQLIGQLINAVLGIVGSIALLMFIYGGFLWMTAAGSDDKVAKGKATLLWASLGLVVIFSSYALVSYLIKNVIKGGG